MSDGQEALADDFSGCGDDDEGMRINRMNVFAEHEGLRPVEHGDDHGHLVMRESALDLLNGGAAVQCGHDVIQNGIGLRCNDLETFSRTENVHDVVDHQGFQQKAENRKKTGFYSSFRISNTGFFLFW